VIECPKDKGGLNLLLWLLLLLLLKFVVENCGRARDGGCGGDCIGVKPLGEKQFCEPVVEGAKDAVVEMGGCGAMLFLQCRKV